MNYQSQPSRMIALFIKLRNSKDIDDNLYTKCCEQTISNNQELYLLYEKYETGLSEQEFLKGLRIIMKTNEDQFFVQFVQNTSELKQSLKQEVKDCFKQIKIDLNKVFQGSFVTQQDAQLTNILINVILNIYQIQSVHLIYLEVNKQINEISEELLLIKHQVPDLRITNWMSKQPSHKIMQTDEDIKIILKFQPQNYFIKIQDTIMFLDFNKESTQQYKQFFLESRVYELLLHLIMKSSLIKSQSTSLTIRSDVLFLISDSIQILVYKLIYLFIQKISQMYNIEQTCYQQERFGWNSILVSMCKDLGQINISLNIDRSQYFINKIEKSFKKYVKNYRKKLNSRKDIIDYFQKISQFNENVLCLFFDQYLKIYYMSTQWNHNIFVDKYQLKDPIQFQDPVYQIFEKNHSVINSIKQLMDSDNDHYECNDGYYKYSIKLTRGFRNQTKNLSVFLYNIHVKRPIKELFHIFRTKVRLLQHLRTATNAFRSKQMAMQNPQYRNTAIVMFLSDKDMQKISGEDEHKFKYVNLESYKSFRVKQKQISYEKMSTKLKNLEPLMPPLGILKVTEHLQQELLDYDCNFLDIEENMHKFTVAYNLFQLCTYSGLLNVPDEKFRNFITIMRQKYNKRKNPFHNFIHGLTVMHGCYLLVHHDKLGIYFSDLEKFALVLSGLCHDVGHTGTTNIFEQNALSKLALRYNDKSILENFHVAETFKILSNELCDILCNVPKSDKSEIRKNMISNILNTDNKNHFIILNDLEIKITQFGTDKNLFQADENRSLLAGFLIHSADFFGAVKPPLIARRWSERLKLEFKTQSQLEEMSGLPLTPYLLNLDDEFVFAKNEAGFLKVIVSPLWETLNTFTQGAFSIQVRNVLQSIKKYEDIANDSPLKQ